MATPFLRPTVGRAYGVTEQAAAACAAMAVADGTGCTTPVLPRQHIEGAGRSSALIVARTRKGGSLTHTTAIMDAVFVT